MRRRIFFSILIAMLVFSFTTLASSEAQIWTEDEQGNIRTDFEPDENVYIGGSGFNPNAQIDISITRPDNVVENYSASSDENGCFLYIYTLDGMFGTYYVTATDGIKSASTTFEDRLRMLEGYDKAASRWERGRIDGWKELDWVSYRIKFRWLPEGESNYTFNVYHNNLLGSNDGVDALRDFHVADEDGNSVSGTVTVLGPFYKTPGKSSDRDIYYSLSVTFTTPLPRLSWYVYWQAHLALGSSGWPGAKLHAYTDITGSQDVPIKVPSVPVGSISGSKWNDLNRDGVRDPSEPGILDWTVQLYFFDPFEDTWVHLADENTNAAGDYTFDGLVMGDYYLAEILQDNWVQTYPPLGTHAVTLSEGENENNIDFGNFFIIHGVEVSISPSYQSGSPGETLNYTVTVMNTGNVADNYDLIVSDNQGWTPSLLESRFENVQPDENRVVMLSVTIPENAENCTKDNITVTATSQADNTVSAENSCIAHVAVVMGVEVEITPGYQSGIPGAVLTYTVTVVNLGNVTDTYDLEVSDNSGWSPVLSENSLSVPVGENRTATLSVTLPADPVGSTEDNVLVTAISRADNTVSAEDTCIAHVNVVRGVQVWIENDYQTAGSCNWLEYTVTIRNTGNVADDFDLSVSDSLGWDNIWLEDNTLWADGDNENTTTLHVHIPENAVPSTEDTITVTAISRTDNTVENSGNCIAQVAIVTDVDVSISPLLDNGLLKDVIITNMGNVVDSYSLIAEDNFSWRLVLAENLVENVTPGENRATTLHITIPSGTKSGTVDRVTVTATSQENAEVSGSESVQVTAVRGVEVSVSPSANGGPPGERLAYIATIKNIGNTWDNYYLTKTDVLGWIVTENFAWIPLAPDNSASVSFEVFIPESAEACTMDIITITATSEENADVSDNDSCIARAIPENAFALELVAGWNLVGFHHVSEDDTPWKIFDGVEHYVWYLDVIWKLLGDSEPFELGVGYWIWLDSAVVMCTTGPPVDNHTLDLIAGWNLVSFPVTSDNTTPENLFDGIEHYVWYLRPGWKLLGDSEPFELGVGYWIWLDSATTVTVPIP